MQANKEPEPTAVQPGQQENLAPDSSEPTICQAPEGAGARVVGGDTTNSCSMSTPASLASSSCTDHAQALRPPTRQEPEAALQGAAEPQSAHTDPGITSDAEVPSASHESCQAMDAERDLAHGTMSRAEQVMVEVSESSFDCVVCWEQCANVVLQPCGHMCTCSACAPTCLGAASLCPLCRCTVVASIQL